MRDEIASTPKLADKLVDKIATSRAIDNLMFSAPELSFVAMLDGTILRVSKSVQDMLGYKEDDLIGRNLVTLHPEEQRSQATEYLKTLCYSKPLNNTLEIVCQAGNHHRVLNTLSLSRIDGNPIIIMISRGLTPRASSDFAAFQSRNLRILYVEDCLTNQQLMKSVITRQGWGIVSAMNGEEGLAEYRKQIFDIILMDIQMPVLDGYQTTRIIRDEERYLNRSTPIIAVTASGGNTGDYLRAGFDDVVFKPFNSSNLVTKIRRYTGFVD
ncbi:MAG: response regulator [Eubacteriales bacterium]|jgi:PAS domain S-box-containing protein|nr:response regulator [Eubacteriales bacterium]MDD4100281.1 response regulator [Candidatus Cloacimonadota bacterium]